MNALLLLLTAATLTLTGCVVLCTDYSSQSYRPAQRPFYQSNRSYCDGYQTYTVGPQYRRAYNSGWGQTSYKNYSNAPVVVSSLSRRTNLIIPQTW